MSRLLTTQEAAELLNVAPSTLVTWRSRRPGTGPAYVKVGALVRYEPHALLAFLARQRVGATDDRPA